MRTFKAVLARQFPVVAGCMRLWYYDQVRFYPIISDCNKMSGS